MRSKSFRSFKNSEGNECVFNKDKFREYIAKKAKDENVTIHFIKENLAEHTSVEIDTLNHWYKGHNGPADIETIEACANYLGIHPDLLLQKKPKEFEDIVMKYEVQVDDKIICNHFNQVNSDKEFILAIYQGLIDIIYADEFILNELEKRGIEFAHKLDLDYKMAIGSLLKAMNFAGPNVSDAIILKMNKKVIAFKDFLEYGSDDEWDDLMWGEYYESDVSVRLYLTREYAISGYVSYLELEKDYVESLGIQGRYEFASVLPDWDYFYPNNVGYYTVDDDFVHMEAEELAALFNPGDAIYIRPYDVSNFILIKSLKKAFRTLMSEI